MLKGLINKEDIDNAWNCNMKNSHKISRKVIGIENNKYEKMKLKVKRLLKLLGYK